MTQSKPSLAAAYFFLAITHDRLREFPDAMANYQQFLKIADRVDFKDEIERVTLRMSSLEKQIRDGKGKKH